MINLDKLTSTLYNKNPGEDLDDVVFNYRMRMCFTKLSEDGLNDMYEYSKMPEFYKYLAGLSPHKNKEDTREYMTLLINRTHNGYYGGKAMYWFLRLKTSKKVIGTLGLVGVDFKKGTATMGKGLSTKYLGKGLMFEAMWTIMKYCFEELGIHTIYTITHRENLPNIALMKACGATESLGNEFARLDEQKPVNLELTLNKSDVKLNKCLALAKIGTV